MLNVNDLIVALLMLTLCPGDTHAGRTRNRLAVGPYFLDVYLHTIPGTSDLLNRNYSNQNKFILIYCGRTEFQRERHICWSNKFVWYMCLYRGALVTINVDVCDVKFNEHTTNIFANSGFCFCFFFGWGSRCIVCISSFGLL